MSKGGALASANPKTCFQRLILNLQD